MGADWGRRRGGPGACLARLRQAVRGVAAESASLRAFAALDCGARAQFIDGCRPGGQGARARQAQPHLPPKTTRLPILAHRASLAAASPRRDGSSALQLGDEKQEPPRRARPPLPVAARLLRTRWPWPLTEPAACRLAVVPERVPVVIVACGQAVAEGELLDLI